MKTIEDYQDYEGIDASLETSLYEYGLIWIKGTTGHEKDFHFIYGVDMNPETGEYNLFDWGDVPIDCNPVEEWDWIKWGEVAKCSGMTVKDFLAMPLPQIVESLVSYYGHENIFGSSYYPFEIQEMGG